MINKLIFTIFYNSTVSSQLLLYFYILFPLYLQKWEKRIKFHKMTKTKG